MIKKCPPLLGLGTQLMFNKNLCQLIEQERHLKEESKYTTYAFLNTQPSCFKALYSVLVSVYQDRITRNSQQKKGENKF